jgi:dynein heavy chain
MFIYYIKVGLAEFSSITYIDWLLKQTCQVILLVNQINFNKRISASLLSKEPLNNLKSYYTELITSLNKVANINTKDLPNYKLLTIEALITIEVHSRDILLDLIEQKINKIDDFEWRRHLKYEWDDQTNQCTVIQSDATFNYGYEYLGCSPRLVITPLTDRCFLTLTGALKLNLGGAPAGPAGTGKTETVKDLAKSVGKLCLVFNCSEGLDYKMLGKFFSGLSQSGSWCCFDEFNRIDIEVLSVVAQQMLTIKTAKDSLAPRFVFEGREIKLNNTCGFFITMNPTYAGRVELPDNLKPLYRPVAMMVPDYALIAEIILFSVGFTSAKTLATKIVTLYHLASRQLSQQDHYDFGMRTIKAVLLMAGQAKKNFNVENQDTQITNIEEKESQILMQALYDTNLPKFLKDDVILFNNLMNDLFPNLSKLNKNQESIEKSINFATRELNYQIWPSQTEKIMQLYDQMLVRHGVMLVGPTGGGKTVARNILQKALTVLPTFEKTEQKQKAPMGIVSIENFN